MGYCTEFEGKVTFNKPLTPKFKEYVNAFCEMRHVKRNNEKIKELFPNWKKLCYDGMLGEEGQFFIGGTEFDNSVIDGNNPPILIPSLWCHWHLNEKDELVWNGIEKFYNYKKWLAYLLFYFFEPNGYLGNGKFFYEGEDWEYDWGNLYVVNNAVSVIYKDKEPYFVYPEVIKK